MRQINTSGKILVVNLGSGDAAIPPGTPVDHPRLLDGFTAVRGQPRELAREPVVVQAVPEVSPVKAVEVILDPPTDLGSQDEPPVTQELPRASSYKKTVRKSTQNEE